MPEFKLSDIKGKKIYTSDGRAVGLVLRFEIDHVQWKVRSLVAKVNDDSIEALDLKKSLLTSNEILIGRDHIKSVGDVVNLNVSMELLKGHLASPTSKKQVLSKR